ncbi:MAG: hypothetical protein V4622_07870 [Bacteroidota bacterium]
MKTIVIILALLFATTTFGQATYNTAIGLRAGETSGLTAKQFIGSSTAIEGIVGAWRYGISATVLFEKYVPAFNTSGLNWYYGAGGHASFKNRYYDRYYYSRRDYYDNYYYNGGFGLGIDGILGIEYKINGAPIAFSLDLKPFFEINTNGGAWGSLDPGLGIKVAF